MTQPTMQMGYCLIAAGATSYPAVASLCGAGLVDAWLEDQRAPDGLKLRSALDPQKLALGAGGLSVPEPDGSTRAWPQGRLFGPEAELRWERLAAGLHLVLLTSTPPPGFSGWVALAEASPEAERDEPALLWGEKGRGGWHEGRIPEVDRIYPAGWSGPRAALITRRYEAVWQPGGGQRPTVRTLVRYLRFEPDYLPQPDPRLAGDKDE